MRSVVAGRYDKVAVDDSPSDTVGRQPAVRPEVRSVSSASWHCRTGPCVSEMRSEAKCRARVAKRSLATRPGSWPTIWPASHARPRGTSRRPRARYHGARRAHDVHRISVFEPMRDPTGRRCEHRMVAGATDCRDAHGYVLPSLV